MHFVFASFVQDHRRVSFTGRGSDERVISCVFAILERTLLG